MRNTEIEAAKYSICETLYLSFLHADISQIFQLTEKLDGTTQLECLRYGYWHSTHILKEIYILHQRNKVVDKSEKL